ncbi:unnamed protein product, partial [Mesorhabditis spiculigera]
MVLTALSIDRYIAVCKPTLVWMRQTQFALFVVLVCVLLSMTFIVPIGVHAKIETMPLTPVVLVDKCTLRIRGYFDLAQAMACFVLPLMLICSVYTAILNKLYRHTRISSVGRKTSISLSRVVKCSVMVVAFYFICWTPYFTMQLHHSLAGDLMDDHETDDNSTSSYSPPQNHTQTNRIGDDPHHTKSPLNISAAVTTSAFEREEMPSVPIFLFYMLHALPYTQSAFNWLFYAFLNRNLRNSGRTANGVRSTASTLIADGNSNGSANGAPLWKNIQQMGSHLKAAGLDTGNLLLKNSPFRTRVKRPFRSATYLEKPTTLLGSHILTAMKHRLILGLLFGLLSSAGALSGGGSHDPDVPRLKASLKAKIEKALQRAAHHLDQAVDEVETPIDASLLESETLRLVKDFENEVDKFSDSDSEEQEHPEPRRKLKTDETDALTEVPFVIQPTDADPVLNDESPLVTPTVEYEEKRFDMDLTRKPKVPIVVDEAATKVPESSSAPTVATSGGISTAVPTVAEVVSSPAPAFEVTQGEASTAMPTVPLTAAPTIATTAAPIVFENIASGVVVTYVPTAVPAQLSRLGPLPSRKGRMRVRAA